MTTTTLPQTFSEPASPSAPAVHVVRREDGLHIEVEVPGYTRSQLSVEVGDHSVSVTGKRSPRGTDFERRLSLPADTDPGRVRATLDGGLLAIHVPKAARTGTRAVEIASTYGINPDATPL